MKVNFQTGKSSRHKWHEVRQTDFFNGFVPFLVQDRKGMIIFMDKNYVFCEFCEKDVLYTVKEECLSAELKGVTYNYIGKTATCDECNNEIYVSNVIDYNLLQLYNEFRKQNNIISLEKIVQIPQKYNIGKRPLSILLGWGEQTFTRYFDGDMPTKQYSEVLQKIYDDPRYYLSVLEANKGKISGTAYEKSKRAALDVLGTDQVYETNEIDITTHYLLCKCDDITPLALQKILYYIQGFYYAFMDRFLFEENCEAWVFGPVYRRIYNKYKDNGAKPIECKDIVNDTLLTGPQKTIIDSVIKNLSGYTGNTLIAFTHLEKPWLVARGDLPPSVSTDREIDKQLIGDYFKDVKQKYNMLTPGDIGEYSRKMYEHISM